MNDNKLGYKQCVEATTNATGIESGEYVSTIDLIGTPNILIVYSPGGNGHILAGELWCCDGPPSVLLVT
jgi:hypothetical protein